MEAWRNEYSCLWISSPPPPPLYVSIEKVSLRVWDGSPSPARLRVREAPAALRHELSASARSGPAQSPASQKRAPRALGSAGILGIARGSGPGSCRTRRAGRKINRGPLPPSSPEVERARESGFGDRSDGFRAAGACASACSHAAPARVNGGRGSLCADRASVAICVTVYTVA